MNAPALLPFLLFAQAGTVAYYGKVILVVAGIVAIVFVVLRMAKIDLPQGVWQIIGILALVFVGALAIGLLAGMI